MDVTAREGIKNDVRIKSSIKQELRERNPEPTDNYLKSIFSTGNHFLYFEPRTLQVFLFCLFFCLFVCLFVLFFFFAYSVCALNDRDKLGCFLKKSAYTGLDRRQDFGDVVLERRFRTSLNLAQERL